jgi:hypothetical protein
MTAAIARGLYPYRQPQWSLQGHDVLIGLVLQAAGFTVAPLGADSPISTGTDRLLSDPQELLDHGAKVVHSVRGSPSGMDEDSVRALFRAAREQGSGQRETVPSAGGDDGPGYD